MANSITIGRHVVRREHIAFVEPYDPDANREFQTSREFKARVVMVDPSDSRLAEETPQAFAEANGFRMLEVDRVAINPAVNFRVETFAPTARFTPQRPYATRLLWRDLDGNDQSKLLLSDPETVLAVAVRGQADALTSAQTPARRPGRRKGLSASAAGSGPEQ